MTNVTTPSPESCVVNLNTVIDLQKDADDSPGKSPFVLRDDMVTNFNFDDLNLTGDDPVTASDLFKVSNKTCVCYFLWSFAINQLY